MEKVEENEEEIVPQKAEKSPKHHVPRRHWEKANPKSIL